MTERLRQQWSPYEPALDEHRDHLARLAYVVVDDRDDDVTNLAISEWPGVDDGGRLRYPEGGRPVVVGVDTQAFGRYLRKRRQPRRLSTRKIRIGDAFAIELSAALREELDLTDADAIEVTPDRDFGGVCIDVSPDAREASKIAMYGAVASVLDTEPDPEVYVREERRRG